MRLEAWELLTPSPFRWRRYNGAMSRVPNNPKETSTRLRQSVTEKKKWQREAESQGVSISALIRHAVNEYINRRKKSARKSR